MVLETGRFLPGVVESLVGQKEGAKVVVPVTFPEQIRDPKLAGLKCEFDIEVRQKGRRREEGGSEGGGRGTVWGSIDGPLGRCVLCVVPCTNGPLCLCVCVCFVVC